MLKGIHFRLKKYLLEPFIRWNFKDGAYLISQNRITKLDDSKLFQNVISYADCSNIYDNNFNTYLKIGMKNEPYYPEQMLRYRVYVACQVAKVASRIPGNFCLIGVSWGVVPKTIYHYLSLNKTDIIYYLLDCWDGSLNHQSDNKINNYCSDFNFIKSSFNDPLFKIIKGFAPDICSAVEGKISFLHLNTGDVDSECKSILALSDKMNPSSFILIDNYDLDGNAKKYNEALERLNHDKFNLLNGQLLVINHS